MELFFLLKFTFLVQWLSFCHFCSVGLSLRAKAAMMTSDKHQCTRNVSYRVNTAILLSFVWFTNLRDGFIARWSYQRLFTDISIADKRIIYVEISKKWSRDQGDNIISYFGLSVIGSQYAFLEFAKIDFLTRVSAIFFGETDDPF